MFEKINSNEELREYFTSDFAEYLEERLDNEFTLEEEGLEFETLSYVMTFVKEDNMVYAVGKKVIKDQDGNHKRIVESEIHSESVDEFVGNVINEDSKRKLLRYV